MFIFSYLLLLSKLIVVYFVSKINIMFDIVVCKRLQSTNNHLF